MKKLSIFISILSVICLSSTAVAADHEGPTPVVPATGSTEVERQAISFLLTSYHELPAKAEFEKTARDPQSILRAIALRGKGMYAERAIEALFLWTSAENFTFMMSLLRADDVKAGRQHRLLMSLGQHYPTLSVDLLGEFLQSEDRALKITAAAALQSIGSAKSFAMIEDAVNNEKDPASKAAMERHARRVR